jgi:hypothetical protein
MSDVRRFGADAVEAVTAVMTRDAKANAPDASRRDSCHNLFDTAHQYITVGLAGRAIV